MITDIFKKSDRVHYIPTKNVKSVEQKECEKVELKHIQTKR